MNDIVKIKTSGGFRFYKVNGDDAIIIHYLLKSGEGIIKYKLTNILKKVMI